MSTRALGIGGLLLALALVALVVFSRDDDLPGTPGPTEGPQGSAPPSTRPATKRASRIRIAGEVRDEAGLPVKGATVYVLSKKRTGANRDKVRHEVTDGRGRWDLRVRKTAGCWVGVVAPGYRTTWLDGDNVDTAASIAHVVRRSPRLEVTVVDEAGTPLAEQGVLLAPWPPGGTWFCPGPQCRQGEQWSVTDANGKASFRQDVSAPVLVTPYVDGRHGHPSSVWLADATGHVTVVMHRDPPLEVRITAATPLDAEDNIITLEFFDPRTRRAAFALTETLPLSGILALKQSLRPGSWHVRVSVPGRPIELVEQVRIPEAAEGGQAPALKIGLGARLANPDAPLTVHLTGNVAERKLPGRRRAPLVYLMRTDGAWAALGWQIGAPESFDDGKGLLHFQLEPGRYRVLVADVLTGRAALDSNVTVAADTGARITLAMKPGQFGTLPSVRDGEVYVRTLEASADDEVPLPIFGSSRDGTQRFRRDVDLIARTLLGEEVMLGPYPLDEFTLTLIHSNGTRTRTSYR